MTERCGSFRSLWRSGECEGPSGMPTPSAGLLTAARCRTFFELARRRVVRSGGRRGGPDHPGQASTGQHRVRRAA
jgi:hypothetical protein